jgi:uncharacterized phage infection (PIP) family protein YhgE
MSLFRWIKDAVDGIMNQILSQVNMVQNLITAPLKAIVNQVIGGIWKGDGATRFANEMTSMVIPSLSNITSSISGYNSAIKKAQEAMEQAVKTATSIASGLGEIFDGIF